MDAQKKHLATAALLLTISAGCSLLSTRPVQDMSDTAAAIRAAKEVQADTLAPEMYRQATEWFFKSKHEYKYKNFDLAKGYAEKARVFAEESEFEAIRNGGNRSDTVTTSDPLAPGLPGPADKAEAAPPKEPYAYPTPAGAPMDSGAPPPGGGTSPPPGGSPPPP